MFHQVHKLQFDDLQFFISDNFEIQGKSLVQKMKKAAIWHFMRTFSEQGSLYITYCKLLTLTGQTLFYCESRWVGWFQLTLLYEHLKIWTVFFSPFASLSVLEEMADIVVDNDMDMERWWLTKRPPRQFRICKASAGATYNYKVSNSI